MTPDATPESRGDKDAYLAARYVEEYVASLKSHERTLNVDSKKRFDGKGCVKRVVTIEWLERGDA